MRCRGSAPEEARLDLCGGYRRSFIDRVIFPRTLFRSNAAESEAARTPEKSIAVLPFDNLSGDPDNAYFTEGVQDEILTRLAKVADLKVIARTSTQRFKSAPENLPRSRSSSG